jgi:ubiquinone/menaquinone biosynthesis C-methylase UbiE
MINGRFFGSPTKIFEYMSLAGGIVASELEQIGEILSPAIHARDLNRNDVKVSNQRSILCEPGNVEQFAHGIEYLLRRPELSAALGRNARQSVVENYTWDHNVKRLCTALIRTGTSAEERTTGNGYGQDSGDAYKNETQAQWDNNPCGSQYVKEAGPHTLAWFREVERYRYEEYAPWMAEVMEFAQHAGEEVLEIGGGIGTDLAQFARHRAHVTDIDLSRGHLKLAEENFRLRGLQGTFIHQDAETLPFSDDAFDVVYSNGVIHHTPNTAQLVSEIFRVLRPGGRAIVMVYAENSWHYWFQLVFRLGMLEGLLENISIGEIMSRNVELTETGARPLVKVYTKKRLENLFKEFSDIQILQRQLTPAELPRIVRSVVSMETAAKAMGWNLIIKAKKP